MFGLPPTSRVPQVSPKPVYFYAPVLLVTHWVTGCRGTRQIPQAPITPGRRRVDQPKGEIRMGLGALRKSYSPRVQFWEAPFRVEKTLSKG